MATLSGVGAEELPSIFADAQRQMVESAAAAQAQIGEGATASDAEGYVTVGVDFYGILESISFDAAIDELSSDDLAQCTDEALQAAREQIRSRQRPAMPDLSHSEVDAQIRRALGVEGDNA